MDQSEEDYELMVCAWADYRKEYMPGWQEMPAAHKAFLAGWQAARSGEQGSVMS